LKVIILINSFGRGGAEISTSAIMMFLKEKYNIEFVGVYLDFHEHGSYNALTEKNIRLIHIKEKIFFKRVFAFYKIVKNEKPDIVNSVLFEANFLARITKCFIKFKYVESLVNTSYSSNREFRNLTLKVKNDIIKFVDTYSAFLVNHFHSVSHAVKSHYQEIYHNKSDKYTVVARARKLPKSNRSFIELKEELNIFTIARQEYQKGLLYLIEAVKNNKNKIVLRIAGREGDATNALKQYIKSHHLEEKIIFVGFTDNLQPFFMGSDAYVSASLFEGSPGSVIEAMSYGMPLLLSDIPEHKEVSIEGFNAVYFEQKNSEAISNLFDKVFQNKYDLNILGQNSFKHFSENFSEDIVYSKIFLMYKNIIK
jgi:glycosyltransferase involved in cell wall biosynthesis